MKHFEHPLKHKPSELLWRMMLAFSGFLIVCGLVLSPWDTLLPQMILPPNAPLPSTKHPMNNKNTNLNRIIP